MRAMRPIAPLNYWIKEYMGSCLEREALSKDLVAGCPLMPRGVLWRDQKLPCSDGQLSG